MSLETWTLVIAIVTAVTCGLCGSLLVVNRQAMVSEGLSHAVLPGLVIAFMVFRRFDSPWLILAAAASGLLMIFLSRFLADTKLVDADAGLGLVFAGMFSFGILLVSMNLKNTHFHADCIIDGNLALAALDRIDIPWLGKIPMSLLVISMTLALIASFIAIAYKELKAMIFDPIHAAQVGLRPGGFRYAWIALVSLTTVTAFDIAGSVLIVALMIAPPASAYLLTRHFGRFLWLSMSIAILAAVTGFYVARHLDISPTGAIASMSGLVFILTWFFNPTSGLVAKWFLSRNRRDRMRRCLAVEVVAGSRNREEAVSRLVHSLKLRPESAAKMAQDLTRQVWLEVDPSGRITIGDAAKRQIREHVDAGPGRVV